MRVLLAGGIVVVALGLGYFGAKALDLMEPLEPAPEPEASGWTNHRGADFSLALPDSWQPIAAGRSQLVELRQTNPLFAEYVQDALKADDPGSKFQLFDRSAVSQRVAADDHFVTNMGVIRARVDLPRAELWRLDVAGLRGLPNRVGPVSRWHVDVDGREALKLRTRIRVRTPFGDRVLLSMTQWSVVAGGHEYVLTYTTTATGERQYGEIFEQSAKTFHLLASRSDAEAPPFGERLDDLCATYIPRLPPPISSREHARQRVQGFARLSRTLGAVDPPPASRTDFMRMVAAVDDLVAAERRIARAEALNDNQASYSAAGDAIDASNRAERYARKLGLEECESGFFWTA